MIDDDELAALALAADPEPLLEEGGASLGADGADLLPEWYMPAPMAGLRPLRGWRRRICLAIIASLVLLNAYGLCSTYGHVGFG